VRPELFLPSGQVPPSVDDIWRFYRNAYLEPDLFGLQEADVARLFDYYCGYGNLDRNPAYFRHQFCVPMRRAIEAAFAPTARPRLLDLCCGVGTPSLLFALLGATVTAVDFDLGQLATLKRRIAGYAEAIGRGLHIDLRQTDLKSTPFADFGRFDVIYSHFGVDQLDNADGILRRAADALRPGGRLILKAMNPQGLWSLAPGSRPPVDPCGAFLQAARAHGFQVVRAGGTGLPRAVWNVPRLAAAVSARLAQTMSLNTAIEYIFQFEETQASVGAAAEYQDA